MTTKTKRNGHPDVNHFAGLAGGYRDRNREGLAKAQGLMSLVDEPAGASPRLDLKSQISNLKSEMKPAASAAPLADVGTLDGNGSRELIPTKFLGACPWQPRKEFDPHALVDLGDSIKANGGNWSDLLVWRVSGSYIVEHAATGGKKLPEYFVLAGERRLRAAITVEWSSLWCRVFDGTAKEAERLARLENLHRADLQPLEAIRNLKAMVTCGQWATQAEVAKEVGLTPAALSNQLRVLELPSEWLDLISQERLTSTHLRALVPWKDYPAVLAAARRELEDSYEWGSTSPSPRMPTVKEWDDAVLDAVKEATRPIKCDKSYFYESHHKGEGKKRTSYAIQSTDMPFPATIKAYREELQIVEVKGLGERAFAAAKWDALAHADKLTRKEQPDKKPSRPKAKALTPAEQKQRDKQQAEQLAKKLYRYKLAWLQKAIVARMADASAATLLTHALMFAASGGHAGVMREHEFGEAVMVCGGIQKSKRHGYMNHTDVWRSLATLANSGEGVDLSGLVRTALAVWYQHDFEQSSSDVPPEFLEGAAAHLGIDFAKEWKLDRKFLELHNHQQLIALAREWKLKGGTNYDLMKRPELIDNLASCVNLVHLPASLAKLEPVAL